MTNALARVMKTAAGGDVGALAALVSPELLNVVGAIAALQGGADALRPPAPPARIAADVRAVAGAWKVPAELIDAAVSVHRQESGDAWKPAAADALAAARFTLADKGAKKDLGGALRRYAAAMYGDARAAEMAGRVGGAFLLTVLAGAGAHVGAIAAAAGEA